MVIEKTPEQPSALATRTIQHSEPLRDCVLRVLDNYFEQLGGQPTTELYELVIGEVEAPLLERVMRAVGGNQSKAAIMLGLSRGTLRKKLKLYGLA